MSNLFYKKHAEALSALSTAYLKGEVQDAAFKSRVIDIMNSRPATPFLPSYAWKIYAADSAMIAWCEAHDVCLSARRPWRWLAADQQRLGEIIGLPGSRGTPRITDGVECMIELEDGSVYIGHLDWFVNEPKTQHWHAPRKRKSAKCANTAIADHIKKNGSITKEQVLALLNV